MTRKGAVGFSQRIRSEWLEYAANLVLAGNSREEIVAALHDRLEDTLSVGSQVERGTRHKAISVLMKVWVDPPPRLYTLRDAGLGLLRNAEAGNRMLIHWCMCMAVYPFFGTVAGITGRVLRLQGDVGAAEVQRRLREQFGQRETVTRAARRILRLFVDWGVLVESGRRGVYRSARPHPIDNTGMAVWVATAILGSRGNRPQPPAPLLRGPHLFPFEIAVPTLRELEGCKALEVTRYGLDQDVLVGLADTESSHVRPR